MEGLLRTQALGSDVEGEELVKRYVKRPLGEFERRWEDLLGVERLGG